MNLSIDVCICFHVMVTENFKYYRNVKSKVKVSLSMAVSAATEILKLLNRNFF